MSSQFGVTNRGAQTAWTQTINQSKPYTGTAWLGTTTSSATIDNGKQAFTNHFKNEIAQMRSFVPPLQRDKFEAAATAAYQSILDKTFNQAPKSDRATWQAAHSLFSAADTEAKAKLGQLADTFKRSTGGWMSRMETACTPVQRFETVGDNKEAITVPKSDLDQAKKDALEYFDARMGELEAITPEDQRADLAGKAKNARLGIESVFSGAANRATKYAKEYAKEEDGKIDGKIFTADLREGLRETQTAMLRQILKLNGKFARIDATPQIFVQRSGGNAGYTVVQRAPKIENLVLGGGGAKGLGTPPALSELSKYGVLSGLKNVVGTSAGALVASCIATGHKADAIEKMMGKEIKMGDFTNSVKDFAKIYPGIELAGMKGYAAQEAVRLLDELTAKGVADYVSSNGQAIEKAAQKGTITAEQATRLKSLGQGYQRDVSRQDRMVTFADLEALHKLAPDKFKTLTLTGHDITNKSDKKALFNAQETPKMPIAFAGRISMSIPFYFKTVKFEGHEYQDGGVKSNMPAEVAEAINPGSRSLLLAFDAGGSAYTILHKRGDLGSNLHSGEGRFAWTSGFAKGKAIGSKNYYETDAADKQKTYTGGPDTHVVFHGDLDTLDLGASQDRQDLAMQVSHLRSLEQIEARQHEGTYHQVDTIEKAYKLLSGDERQAIVAAGPPTAKTYPNEPDLEAAQKLYDRCFKGVAEQV
jgi:predicted acylesterase/phospholipase RssA